MNAISRLNVEIPSMSSAIHGNIEQYGIDASVSLSSITPPEWGAHDSIPLPTTMHGNDRVS
jgi:hypothetical protein